MWMPYCMLNSPQLVPGVPDQQRSEGPIVMRGIDEAAGDLGSHL